jgi:oxygen-dependent protoporphyrinogen oxidase
MNQDKRRVAVIGGGISGLAAAHRLCSSDAGLQITLLEASDRLGGVLQTEQRDGFCIELGPDSMLSRLPWAVDLCRSLGMADELISTSSTNQGVYVVCRGRLERLPEGLAVMAPQRIWPMVKSPILSWPGKLRLGVERFIPPRRQAGDESLADFARRRLGREAFERLVQPLAGGIYMGDPEQLSVQATFPQFVEMESKHGSLIKAARSSAQPRSAPSSSQRNSTHSQPPQSGGPAYSLFVAPRRGLGSLIETLAGQLPGCRIQLRQEVQAISRHSQGWSLQIRDHPAEQSRQEDFAAVIVAVPAHRARVMLEPASGPLAELLGQIPYAGCIVVNLGYQREAFARPLDSFGFVVPHVERRRVLACTFSSVKYPGRADDRHVLLRAFLGGACFPEVMEWLDERIEQTVRYELCQLLGVVAQPLFCRIQRWDGAMPQFTLGHPGRVQQIEQMAAQLPCLELAGNAYHGVGIPHCIRSGQQASDRLLAALRQ